MSLRDLAAADLAFTLGDAAGGFGWPITLTDPDGETYDLVGQSGDISQMIDPDTGQAVSGRSAHVAIALAALTAAGAELPVGVSDTATKPWIAGFDDIQGGAWSFKVVETRPDRALGIVVCVLEVYS